MKWTGADDIAIARLYEARQRRLRSHGRDYVYRLLYAAEHDLCHKRQHNTRVRIEASREYLDSLWRPSEDTFSHDPESPRGYLQQHFWQTS